MRTPIFFLSLLALLPVTLPAQNVATLRPGDVFQMRVGGVAQEFTQEFTQEYSVSQEGTVNLPEIGEVQAVGLTPPQLQKVIENKLIAGQIFTRPAVNINVMQNVRTVTVGGSVRGSGRQQWSPDMTLTSSIAAAGGTTEWANRKVVRLVRGGKIQVYDLRKIDRDPGQDPKLLPGDQVIVTGD